ncbi:putative bifunctional diguanylate cyclase/phosphodiesterase [Amphritea balenae]|uniref:Bifunctional diguanylate cyclase/phosphodiesterase n=1 Tax=Amphritea balenae TaxID=452629 RepID=A0A3P1SQR4_9GAMM|nr:bifunctional diguanylate cyclase/phosphodiesterase [Amphritea balenae]RRC98985.1 bifunctional diguanylate cyclase/phosphodiesterase [Amphritea balenae]GGK63431.1 GGDEF-domain containing protein [Amphritea balenae]
MLSAVTRHSENECLIIDSCGFSLQDLNELLASVDCAAQHCSFDQVTHLMEQHDFKLIFLHTCVTDTNALSELHFLRQQYPTTPVIVFDQQLSQSRIDEFLLWRASDYVSITQLDTKTIQRVIRYNLSIKQHLTDIVRLNKVDPLTGMTNRQQFYKELSRQLKPFQQSKQHNSLALFIIDLDGFRRFNNINGHAAGDKIVKKLGDRLTKLAPALITRLGNDEFALTLTADPDDDLVQRATLLCYQILHALTKPYQYHELEIILPCSIGIALAPQHSCEPDSLIHQATQARLKAKEQSSCSYFIFDQQHSHLNEKQVVIEPELISAVRRREFELYYQPRVDISNGNIIGAEGLIRWNHPEKGLIFPDEFIPTAERTGLIVPMGYWVLQQAGEDIHRLREAGLDIKHLSINLSFRQFQDGYLCRTIQRIIEKYDIDTSILEFELTESALFNNELHVREGIEELHKLGINFSLDDFGTGYSSFSLLQKLPISSLKIDRSFVAGVADNQDDREIVKALIRLAHSLNKEVIAEGLETRQQLNFLASYGCTQAQGYLYSKPVPFAEFQQQLAEGIQTKEPIAASL